MKLAFVYAGQGSQRAGMGRDLYEAYPAARRAFDAARLDFDVKKLCFEGPEELLNRTEYTQPCLAAYAVAVTEELRQRGIAPSMAAGLSLGEYSALWAAGALGAQELLELVRFRGRAMEQAARGRDTTMLALLGAAPEAIEQAVEQARAEGFVQVANYNCPGQTVIAGEEAAARKAAELSGAKRVIPLAVSGPFHTTLMEPAARALEGRLAHTAFAPLAIPVVHNATGAALQPGETLPGLLVRQVMSPVRFTDCIRTLEQAGVDTIVEIGPGHALCGFIRKTAPHIKTAAIEDCASLEAAVALCKGENNGTEK